MHTDSMNEDLSTRWRDLLLKSTRRALEEFWKRIPLSDLSALGYFTEFGQPSANFYLCAETIRHDAENRETYKTLSKSEMEDIRWNSGDFKFPAGLISSHDELGPDWNLEMERLNQRVHEIVKATLEADALRKNTDEPTEVVIPEMDVLTDVCCDVLAILATEDFPEHASRLDFIVQDVDDTRQTTKVRNREIHERISCRLKTHE